MPNYLTRAQRRLIDQFNPRTQNNERLALAFIMSHGGQVSLTQVQRGIQVLGFTASIEGVQAILEEFTRRGLVTVSRPNGFSVYQAKSEG